MFLIRPPPRPLESLSSWRQRAGAANGFRHYPRPDGRYGRTDPDRLPELVERKWLTDEFRIAEAEILRTSLDSFAGNVDPDLALKVKLRWVIPVGNRKPNSFGPACCAQCLAEDDVPYFRIAWRFAFLCACPLHGCELIDHCFECGEALWPSIKRTDLVEGWYDFRRCPRCREILSSHQGSPAESTAMSRDLWRCAFEGVVPENLAQAENSREVFSGLWALCQLLLRGQSVHLWKFLQDVEGGPTGERAFTGCSDTIELLPLQYRTPVLKAAYWLMQGWPDRLLTIAEQGAISRQHFTATRNLHPKWLASVVENSLALRTTGITKEQVQLAIEAIEVSGAVLTKSAVRRALNVSEARAINEMLSQRRKAMVSELITLCRKFEAKLVTVPTSRDQRATLIRDYLILMVSVLSEKPVETACRMSEAEVTELLAGNVVTELHDRPAHQLISVRARQLNEIYRTAGRQELIGQKLKVMQWFISRNGEPLAGHTIRERIAKMMRSGFPAELWKSADVFFMALRN